MAGGDGGDPFRTQPPQEDAHATLAPDVDDDSLDEDEVETGLAPSEDSPPTPETGWRAFQLVGKTIGPWTLELLLGEGGWGAVFRAHRTDDSGQVAAVKIPKLGESEDSSERLARFRREIECVQAIHADGGGQHVVGLQGADPDASPYPWLALELVDGVDVGQLLKQRRKLPVHEALVLALGTLDGLSHAHRAGVVHRDLKPSNVLRSYAGDIRLADFGVARTVRRDGDALQVAGFGLTTTGQQIGTVHYMSPEAIEGKPVEEAGDLYSFGALVYALIAGRPPFRGSLVQVYNGHLLEDPAPLSHFAVGVPAELDDLVHQLLAKDPAKRPNTEEARSRLKTLLSKVERTGDAPTRAVARVAVELSRGDEVDDERTGARSTILRELGRGGMGIAYAVEDRDGDVYALKVAAHGVAAHEAGRQQLIRDAENAIRVGEHQPHSAVARVHRVGTSVVRGSQIVFLISELVDGPSMASLVDTAGPIDDHVALELWIQVAEGLSAIHESGVVHLDLTPGNILLGGVKLGDDPHAALPEASPKIVDFGISREVASITLRGVEGNPLYMSPEQCDGLRPTFASDIYMLGATFYHVTTGRPVFPGGDPLAVLSQHRSKAPRFADLESPLGHDLALVIHKCLFKDPEDRYGSVAELVADLRCVGESKFPRSQLKAAWARERKELAAPRAPWRIFVATAAVAVLVLIGLISSFVDRLTDDHRMKTVSTELQRAEPAELPELILRGEGFAARHYDEDAAHAELYQQVTERVRGIQAEATTLLRRQVSSVVDEPHKTKAAVEAQQARLAALRVRIEGDGGLEVRGLVTPAELSEQERIEGEAATIARLCDLSSCVAAKDWDRARGLMRELPATDLAKPARLELEARTRAGVASLEASWNEVRGKVRGKLGAKTFEGNLEALELLDAFTDAHPSFASLALVAGEVRELRGLLKAASANEDPLLRRAETELRDLEQDQLKDLPGLLRGAPARREDLAKAIRLLQAFASKQVSSEGVTRSFAETSAGERAAALRDECLQVWERWARASWTEVSRASPMESPADYQEHLAALERFERAWKPPVGASPTFEDSGQRLPLERSVGLARERCKERAASAATQHLEEARKLLRARPLRSEQLQRAQTRARDAQVFARGLGGVSSVERDAKGVLEQVAELRKLNGEAVRFQELSVDGCEMRVRTYAVFLEEVRRLGRDHAKELGCHTSERRGDTHRPAGWEEQLKTPEHPVVGVTWTDAFACLAWAGRRLPAASEWIAFARGVPPVDTRKAEWRRGAERAGWKGRELLPAGRSGEEPAGLVGLRDTAGNVAEWVADHYACGPDVEDFGISLDRAHMLGLKRKPVGPTPYLGFRGVRDE